MIVVGGSSDTDQEATGAFQVRNSKLTERS